LSTTNNQHLIPTTHHQPPPSFFLGGTETDIFLVTRTFFLPSARNKKMSVACFPSKKKQRKAELLLGTALE
ncbi:hypothetical protein, partial [Bosea sp. (in: a-proteobacteria)]|uniref:hypothetical protein n=1 Tax=Bosea sp. (in: a-proteobacteria) TaxID=1871050 RepID=UPI0031FEFFEF